VAQGRWQGGDVAIKVIHCLPQEVNRVLREAEILMGVQHDHIVRCFKCCVVQSDREAAFQPGRMDDNISDQVSLGVQCIRDDAGHPVASRCFDDNAVADALGQDAWDRSTCCRMA
jgi:hypothetical protein